MSATTALRHRAFLFGFFAIWGVTYLGGALSTTGIELGLVAAAATVATALLIERNEFGVRGSPAVARLGLGRPTSGSLAASLVVAALVVAVVPVYAWSTGTELQLRPGWPWLAVGLVAYHGVAEEVAWRGYAFGHLRRSASFGIAVRRTMPLIALTHLPIVIEAGPAVGVAAMIVAIVTCIPLAHLCELGRGTIWAAAIVHAAIDTFKLIEAPGRQAGRPSQSPRLLLSCPSSPSSGAGHRSPQACEHDPANLDN
jgi:membrane protease YdiL (CAAX protease family)